MKTSRMIRYPSSTRQNSTHTSLVRRGAGRAGSKELQEKMKKASPRGKYHRYSQESCQWGRIKGVIKQKKVSSTREAPLPQRRSTRLLARISRRD